VVSIVIGVPLKPSILKIPHLWKPHIDQLFLPGWWFQPLCKISKSVGITIPNIWKNIIHVPNHQPVTILPTFQKRFAPSAAGWRLQTPAPRTRSERLRGCRRWIGIPQKIVLVWLNSNPKDSTGWGPPVISWFIYRYNPH
jgi:hypothetical protein